MACRHIGSISNVDPEGRTNLAPVRSEVLSPKRSMLEAERDRKRLIPLLRNAAG
jgi:hypothetical protein